jgi:hypothetical protein
MKKDNNNLVQKDYWKEMFGIYLLAKLKSSEIFMKIKYDY